jgi:peptide-methionine (S)-S-oxide reductase
MFLQDRIMEKAIFGGGCFWCLEAVFEQLNGVHHVVSGYAGGASAFPSYESVCAGTSGHAEVVEIEFDTSLISYRQLLEVFFAIHDPTTLNRQGADVGTQYRSVIFALNEQQRTVAMTLLEEFAQSSSFAAPIVTQLVDAPTFYPAEPYHQGYFRKNPEQGYCAVVVAPKVNKARRIFAEWLKLPRS